MSRRTHVSIDGHRIELTNLDKVLYPETGTTKADVLGYYIDVAPMLIAHAGWRPATLKRWVDGVGTSADPRPSFFQKNVEASAPSWVKRFPIEHSDHVNHYPLPTTTATLAWFAQLNALEIHTPQWRFGPRGGRRNPDRLVIDLDPGEGVDLAQCAAVARIVRDRLRDDGLDPCPVTSGSKGIHLYAALDGSRSSEKVAAWAHEVARSIEGEHRDLVVSDMARRLRRGKVLIDWSQNNGSKTTVAPYSLRGRARPTVAAPRTWRELASPRLRHLEYTDVLRRVAEGRADPLQALADVGEGAPDPDDDLLAARRRQRAPAVTSSPLPSFVIQEHHASRHHYDLRLEHDGALVSWALPTGVPTDPGLDHLAIRTEDHPLGYGLVDASSAGEHGGGTVRPWDNGTLDLHTWREGEEVVATLHGTPGGGLGGSRRFALVHTGRRGEDDDHWLIHAMDHWDGRPPAAIPVEPMLASPARDGELSSTGWQYEMKWDGIRAVCEVADGTTRMWSRNGNDLTGAFPELAEQLPGALGGRDGVVDGEIVAMDARGRPSFQQLQDRLGVAALDAATRARRTPVHLMLFDVLAVDRRLTVDLAYRERRALLESLVVETSRVHVPPSYDTDLDDALAISERHGLEGVVAKRPESRYLSGRRASSWRKVKHERAQEVVVAGWIDGKAGGLGSLVLAVPTTEGGLRYAGKVGTGFSERDRASLHDALTPLRRRTAAIPDMPRTATDVVHWVEPSLVGEVRFSEWTRSGSMRHPSWRGLRHDKSPADLEPPAT